MNSLMNIFMVTFSVVGISGVAVFIADPLVYRMNPAHPFRLWWQKHLGFSTEGDEEEI